MPKHCNGVSEGTTTGVLKSAIGRRVKGMQGSWVVSVSKWFADEKEDTGLQTAENSRFFGIASSIKSFSNEGKELIIQYQAYVKLHPANRDVLYSAHRAVWSDHRNA